VSITISPAAIDLEGNTITEAQRKIAAGDISGFWEPSFIAELGRLSLAGYGSVYSAARDKLGPNLCASKLDEAVKLERRNFKREMAQLNLTPNPEAFGEHASLLAQSLSDVGNGQRFIALYGHMARYCHEFRAWLIYSLGRWVVDRSGMARKLMQAVMVEFVRQALASGNDSFSKFAGGCLNSQRITSALREAEPHLPVTVDELDVNPHLLNFTDCTVDLRSGSALDHNPGDLITKQVPYPYTPEAECPEFLRCIARVLPGLEDYLQKALGYSMSGITSEKVVFLCHGSGNNGKTTILATVRELLGNGYATLLQIDSLMARESDNNSQADLAGLRGARFAMTSETAQGQRLNDGRLKRITQGTGRIKAVKKYEDLIEFRESHTLWMDANFKPVIHGNDPAIWNRFRLIPFEIKIPDSEIDRELPSKLMAEAEGILAWMVAGAVRWYAEGLGRPEAVDSAVEKWHSDTDSLGRFLDECCQQGEYFQAKARPFYTAYRLWAEAAGDRPLTETEFSEEMASRGFKKDRNNAGMAYLGIAIPQVVKKANDSQKDDGKTDAQASERVGV
jgi:putative DNA primase/helicase